MGAPGEGHPRLYFVKVPESKTTKNRLHLDLMPSDRTKTRKPGSPVGASIISDRRPELGWVILADSEGNEFCVEMTRRTRRRPGRGHPA